MIAEQNEHRSGVRSHLERRDSVLPNDAGKRLLFTLSEEDEQPVIVVALEVRVILHSRSGVGRDPPSFAKLPDPFLGLEP